MNPADFASSLRATGAALSLLTLAACGPAPTAARSSGPSDVPGDLTRPMDAPRGNTSAGGSGRQRQMEFLNRIRAADPQGRTIDRAMLNEQNELGLILDRSVEMDKIPALMRTMLGQMAKEFPGEDLAIHAYTPSNPPRKIGTAHLDARSRDMSYTPAQ